MMLNNKIYSELLSQGNYIRLSKRLIANLGLEMAVFLSFLIDKYDFYYNQNSLTNGCFYSTDNDMLLFTGLKSNTISTLKKEGQAQNLFSIKKLGVPAKTFYQINFDKINEFFVSEKTIEETAYERLFKEKIDTKNFNFEDLKSLSKKELQLLCKKKSIKYFGNFTKNKLIEVILKNNKIQVEEKEEEVLDIKTISNKNFRELRLICKRLGIAYSGKDSKSIILNKILDRLNGKKEVDDLVLNLFENKCSNKSVTSYQKIWNNQEQILITNEQQQTHDHSDDAVDEFKQLFDEFRINFTNKNRNAIQKLLNKMSKEKVINYLKDTFNNLVNNPNVHNVPALFSEKISKGETQEPFISTKKELDNEKKKWLSYFAGIVADKSLKADIESIIIDIPLNILAKNKRRLAMMSMFEFKQCLLSLKRNC